MSVRLPGYRITSRLGKGGMAHVFLATQHSFERQVAIKVLSPSLAMEPRFAEQFMHEARTVASLNHPHIVPVYDVGEHEGYFYLSMEYVTGGSLKERIQRGMSEEEAVSVLRQIASALDYAGQQGFVHRDVKPDNIMFRSDGSAVLMDFGIASNILKDMDRTLTNKVMGTPKYMSPEQHKGKTLTPQVDLYALGCIFFEMLSGKAPYEAPDAASMGVAHLRNPVPLLPVHLRRYQPIIRQLLAKEPDDRPASGAALIDDIDSLPEAEHFQKDAASFRPVDTGNTPTLTPRLRLKEVRAGRSWRGTLYQYDVYLVAEEFSQCQDHLPVLRSALEEWHSKRGKRCHSLRIKATVHPWISGRVKQALKSLRETESLNFLQEIPMLLNLVGSDGEPIERKMWAPQTGKKKGTSDSVE